MEIFMQDSIKIWSGTKALSALFKLVHCVLPAVCRVKLVFILKMSDVGGGIVHSSSSVSKHICLRLSTWWHTEVLG